MTIPEPVASTACTEETSLARAERKTARAQSRPRTAESPAQPFGLTLPRRRQTWGAGSADSPATPARPGPAPARGGRGGASVARAAAPRREQPPGFLPPPFSALGPAAGRGGAGWAAARAPGASRQRRYLVLIITQSVRLHPGRERRSAQVQSAKSPGKKSAPQASVSSIGAAGPAASLAPRGWVRLGAPRPGRAFLPSAPSPSRLRPALAPIPRRGSARDQAWRPR